MTGYAEARHVLEDPTTFVSGFGTGATSPHDGQFSLTSWDPSCPLHRTLNLTDPPAHGPLRKRVEQLLRLKLPELPCTLQEGDFVALTARPMSAVVLQTLLPAIPSDLLRRIAYADDPDFCSPGLTPAQSWARAEEELRTCLGGEPDEFHMWRLLLLSGQESTSAALCGAALELARHPEQASRLRQQPALLPSAVEEILRWTSPISRFGRLVTRPVTLGEQNLVPAERVVVFLPAANRDPLAFGRADELLLQRKPNRHLAFGAGPHRCPGAGLARLLLTALLERMLALDLWPELWKEPVFYRSSFTVGCKELFLRWAKARR